MSHDHSKYVDNIPTPLINTSNRLSDQLNQSIGISYMYTQKYKWPNSLSQHLIYIVELNP